VSDATSVHERRIVSERSQQLMSAEYSSLRDELLRNKQYVFERPLVIVTVAGIASVQLSGEPSVVFLPLLLSTLLLSNLWFTVNRLRSTARIAAYVAVVLEPASDAEWIGWENSLRLYRIWRKTNTAEEQKSKTQKHINIKAIPDAMMFYPALWWLHVATASVALLVSICSVCKAVTALTLLAFVLTLLASGMIGWFGLGPYHPSKMRDLIEVDDAVWKVVLGERDEAVRPPR
jgi:hypothetical protein